jgi:hypothetical protein
MIPLLETMLVTHTYLDVFVLYTCKCTGVKDFTGSFRFNSSVVQCTFSLFKQGVTKDLSVLSFKRVKF